LHTLALVAGKQRTSVIELKSRTSAEPGLGVLTASLTDPIPLAAAPFPSGVPSVRNPDAWAGEQDG
jgi:hypothetical protein